jgi:hypothetical protein
MYAVPDVYSQSVSQSVAICDLNVTSAFSRHLVNMRKDGDCSISLNVGTDSESRSYAFTIQRP